MFNRDVIEVPHYRDSFEYINKQTNNEFPESVQIFPSRWMKTDGPAHPPPPRDIELNQLLVTTCVITVLVINRKRN